MRAFYTSTYQSFSEYVFAHIFCHHLWLIFSFSSHGTSQSKHLILNKVQLINYSFMDHAFDIKSELWLVLSSTDFLLFSSQKFYIFMFYFKSVIHFRLIFIYFVKFRSKFFFFSYSCLIDPATFSEKALSYAELLLNPCKKSIEHMCDDYFWVL